MGTPLIFYVTPEEDRLVASFDRYIQEREPHSKKRRDQASVYNSAFGLKDLHAYVADWGKMEFPGNVPGPHDINTTLTHVYQKRDLKDRQFYLFLDAGQLLMDYHVARRVLNIVAQVKQNPKVSKTLIFTGPKRLFPEKLAPYMTVVVDPGPTEEEILKEIPQELFPGQDLTEVTRYLRGFSMYQVSQAIQLSYLGTKDPGPARLDRTLIEKFRRSTAAHSERVSVLNTQKSFEALGGASLFKTWAHKMRHAWTDAGKAFGLRPPRGVLLMGIYGCGKSLAVKALADCWQLPLVDLDIGRIRSSGVGESESNMREALTAIEALAPCVVQIDEAEKALSGGESSAQSDSGVTSRLLGIFSTWLQETTAEVCVAMTANTLKSMPPELVNRMTERFFFELPDTATREAILRIHIEKRVPGALVNYGTLAVAAEGLVGRELEQSVEEALLDSFDQGHATIQEALLEQALLRRPRLKDTMQKEVSELTDWVGYAGGDGIRARLASPRG